VSAESTASQTSTDIDSLQADVEETRRDLAQTVDALGTKLDVKARTRQRLETSRQHAAERLESARSRARSLTDTVRDSATDEDGEVRREVLVTTGMLAVSLTALVVLGVRRRGR